jgi:hypothetical protein
MDGIKPRGSLMENHVTSVEKILSAFEIESVCGPWPVLCTEDEEQFEKIVSGFAKCLTADDMVVGAYVVRLATATFQIKRLQSASVHQIESRQREIVRNNAMTVAAKAINKDAAVRQEAEKKANAMLARAPDAGDMNGALVASLDRQEVLHKLIAQERREFDTALASLERYRKGLAKALKRVADDIVSNSPAGNAPTAVPAGNGAAH